MKKMTAILGTGLFFSSLFSLPVSARDWRSEIDKYLTTKDVNGREKGDLYFDNPSAANLAWAESYYLETFLQLYRTYRDRKYLDRFKKHGDKIIQNMSDTDGDGFFGWNDPRYGTNKILNGDFETYELLTHSILSNGGFETADAGDPTLPSGWTRSTNATYAYRSPGGAGEYDGAYAVLKTTPSGSLLQYPWTTYKSSTSYQLSFVGRTNGLVKGRVDIRDESVSPAIVLKSYLFSNTDWTRHSFLFLTPLATGHTLTVRFNFDNNMVIGGEADVDDVRLAENLIINGGFEEGGAFPTSWFVPSGSGDSDHLKRTLNPGDFVSGKAGLEARSEANQYEILEQYFPYEAGATYTVSFYGKTNGKVKGRFDVYDHNWTAPATKGQFTQVYFNHTDWRRYTLTFTAPPVSGHKLGVRCFDERPAQVGGLVYFDDISVVKAASANIPGKGTVLLNWNAFGKNAYPSVSAGGPSTALVLEGSAVAEQTILPGYLPGWEYEVSLAGSGGVRVEILDWSSSFAGKDFTLSSWTIPQTFRFKMPSSGGHAITLRLTGQGSSVALDDLSLRIAGENIVHYGKIASPLAAFVTLVKNDPSLAPAYGASAQTYQGAIEQQIIPRWESSWRDISPTQGVYINPDNECQENDPAGISLPHNQYLAFARLLLESYKFYGNTAYLDRAVKMGNAFKSKLRINSTHPSAYTWDYSNDMKPDDDGFAETHYSEDSSHANIDIGFAIEMFHQGLVFDQSDMNRFVSTFHEVMYRSPTATFDTVDGVRTNLNYRAYGEWVNLSEFSSDVWTQVQGILEGSQSSIYYGTLQSMAGLCRWDPAHQTVTGAILSDLTGVAETSDRLHWSWADRADNENGFQVRRATDNFELVTLASSAVSYTEQGLLPNTSHQVRVTAFGGSPIVATVGISSPIFTLANVPINLSTTGVTATTVGLSFSANGNPPGTRYEIEQALGQGAFSLALTTTALTPTVMGLSDFTNYRFRVRALNNDGIPTGYSPTLALLTLDGTRPIISLTGPAANSAFTTVQTVGVTAAASDNVGVTKVWFILDGVTVSTATTAPYSYDWPITSANNGAHIWQATVFDALGNSSTTVGVPVTVDIDVSKPTVALTAPVPGTTYTTPQSVPITANATDNVGVSTVWFILNGVVISTDTAAPYAYSWPITGANNGTYSWTATAFDAMGNSSTTVGVPVTVNIDVLPPSTPVLLAPTEISSTTVRLNWSAATDNVGVAGYRLYRGTSPIATISGEETTYLDTGLLPATRYKYTVSAFDALGNTSALSPELSVTTKRKPLPTPRGSLSGVSSQSVGIRWPAVEGANLYTLAASVSETSETEFAVQREIQQSESSDIETISGLLPNTTYYLYLNACDESQCTEFAPVGSAVTHALAPALTTAEGKGKEFRLTINGNGNPVGTKYRIEMSRGGGEFTLATTGTSLSPVIGDLAPGERYTFRVKAENHAGVTTEPSSTLNAALAPGNVEGARAYPVPFRPGSGAAGITFDKMPEGATVKIYTVDGRPVKTLTADVDGMALWTLDNDDGSSVVSGVYMAMIEKDGTRKKLKVVVQK